LTDFDQTWHALHGNAVRPSLAVRPLKIHDGGDRDLQKSKYRHISAMAEPIATRFGKLAQFDPLTIPFRKSAPVL